MTGVVGSLELMAASGAAHREQVKARRTTAAPQRVLLVAAHADRGALDDHARQTLAGAALIADTQTEVVLLVFGEFTGDAAALGADKLIELPMFDRRRFAPVDELNALAACVVAYAPVHVFLPITPLATAISAVVMPRLRMRASRRTWSRSTPRMSRLMSTRIRRSPRVRYRT